MDKGIPAGESVPGGCVASSEATGASAGTDARTPAGPSPALLPHRLVSWLTWNLRGSGPTVRDDLIDMGCVAVTVAVAFAVATSERSAFRAVVGVIFALYVPGRALVSNWPSMAARSNVAASVLFSLSILTLLATVTLWAGYWHPLGLLEVECLAVGVTLFTGLLRRRRADQARVAIPAVAESAFTLRDLDS